MMPTWMLHTHRATWHLYNRTWGDEHIAECGARLSMERTERFEPLIDRTESSSCKHCLKTAAKMEATP